MHGDGVTQPIACENFQPHADLCPEPDSGPWYCNTDGFTDFVGCDGCRSYHHPDKVKTCILVESDGNQDSYQLCDDCRSEPKKGVTPHA